MSYDPRTHTTAKQTGPRRVIYPFLNGPIKDSTTKIYERDMLVLPASFAPFTGAASTHVESAEALQGSDAAAYIVSESPISISGGMGSFTRTYANIPTAQIIPSSRFFNRPLMDDVFSGGSYAVSFDGLKSWVFTSRISISSIGTLTPGTIPRDVAAQTLGTLPSSTATFVDSFPTTVAITLSSAASSIQTSLV